MKVMTQFHERLRAQAETSQLAIRWRGLPARDRLALLWLGAFLLLVVLYLALWRPAERHLQSARQYFTEQRALHAYIQQQAPNVRQADAARHRRRSTRRRCRAWSRLRRPRPD